MSFVTSVTPLKCSWDLLVTSLYHDDGQENRFSWKPPLSVMDGIFVAQCIALASTPILLLVSYVYWNDRRLIRIPPRALDISPKRHTAVDVHAEVERLAASPPIDDTESIPPKTGRRYIVVGGVSCYNDYEHRKGLFS